MTRLPAVLLASIALALGPVAARSQTLVTLATGFQQVSGLAVDGSGNLFIAERNASSVTEVFAAGGYKTTKALGSGLSNPGGIALDVSGNVFVADSGNNAVKEILATGGYVTVTTLGGGFNNPTGVAVDGSGNVFVADWGNNAVKEILAAGGHIGSIILGSGFEHPSAVALDAADNVFVADTYHNALKEIVAQGGYNTVKALGGPYPVSDATTVALDPFGNILAMNGNYVTEYFPDSLGTYADFAQLALIDSEGPVAVDSQGHYLVAVGSNIEEFQTNSVASITPGSRSVQLGSAATVFASIINTGKTAETCGIYLPYPVPQGLSLTFQTTDPETNAPTGTPNTTVSIPGNNGLQSFVLSFQGTAPSTSLGLPLQFSCSETTPSPSIPGVNTIDLSLSSTPVPDIIAIAATSANNGTVTIPIGGAAAFSIASTNLGVAAPLMVSVDTGTATLPINAAICQSDPSSGQCLASPATSLSLDYAAGAAPTFSVFLQASGAVPFAPATSRIFVRFKDASGGLHGSTSVAVEAQ